MQGRGRAPHSCLRKPSHERPPRKLVATTQIRRYSFWDCLFLLTQMLCDKRHDHKPTKAVLRLIDELSALLRVKQMACVESAANRSRLAPNLGGGASDAHVCSLRAETWMDAAAEAKDTSLRWPNTELGSRLCGKIGSGGARHWCGQTARDEDEISTHAHLVSMLVTAEQITSGMRESSYLSQDEAKDQAPSVFNRWSVRVLVPTQLPRPAKRPAAQRELRQAPHSQQSIIHRPLHNTTIKSSRATC